MTAPALTPVLRRLSCLAKDGFHDMAYWEWGAPDAPRTALCVHGLSRNGRDFDDLAAALVEAGWRVVCPDVVGRGESGRLRDPLDYNPLQYRSDLVALVARLGVEQLDWIGTSMGGLIAMVTACLPGHPIRRLVLNDIGPFVPKAALERIAASVGQDPTWPDLEAAETFLRQAYAPFGIRGDAQWRHFTEISVRARPEGGWGRNYDPRIAAAFEAGALKDIDLWAQWDLLDLPVLVLRGAESDVLLPETAAEMARRGPRAEVLELPGCGHAPPLLEPSQTAPVVEWLRGGA
ncbi:Pimeloyl-ACP methyl ester carboxylesterase [Tistlia consotensis]|uniref:Pimeloyl-ACP methyl ester carboxylesterase n=1 Tax=Tistlia consotensis USBA 355 TaxID=560819 RepID=A0A1Y6C673_9PROT|nr:alpha/beta fold hydrolase [Tistlia consotensis]SMF44034.1 Pimeloyl-ACP methyl ester carboxylesterase [Tistlia consotensis USBA 355]SNR43035.1 Pimeloyl-ACP methyl ester carboxylesterase [Tistlia consotensis]